MSASIHPPAGTPGRTPDRTPRDEQHGLRRSLCWSAGLCLVLWLAGTLITLLTRAPIPPDETRVLAVAWGMWADGDFLVPQLNGEPYAEKPPLLHWLIHAGWALGGVGETWPRLLSPLLALLALGLCTRIARQLWPGQPLTAALAPLLLAGSLFWTALTPLLLYDTLLTSCSLLALVALLGTFQPGRRSEREPSAGLGAGLAARPGAWFVVWLFVGVALGLGLLAKGPAAWLGFLPVALAAPLWARARRPPSWPAHYGGVLLALAVGAGLFLLWALPACAQAGSAYRETLFGQAAARLAGEERGTHAEPWWWYLPRLLPLLLPWALWPALWRALAALLRGDASLPSSRSGTKARLDDGTRLCLVWIGGALTALSLIAGKQEHYLLPLLPACALLAARALAGCGPAASVSRPVRRLLEAVLTALPVLLAGLALWLGQSGRLSAPAIVSRLPAALGPALMVLGVGLVLGAGLMRGTGAALRSRRDGVAAVALLAVGQAGALLLALAFVLPLIAEENDVRPAAQAVAELQAQGHAIASLRRPRGELDFAGRLRAPIRNLLPEELPAWLAAHPEGWLLSRRLDEHERRPGTRDFPGGYALTPAADR